MLLRPGQLTLDELQGIHADLQPLHLDPLSLPAVAAAVGDLLTRLHLQPALVVGHSAGAAVALQMVLAGLVILCGTALATSTRSNWPFRWAMVSAGTEVSSQKNTMARSAAGCGPTGCGSWRARRRASRCRRRHWWCWPPK